MALLGAQKALAMEEKALAGAQAELARNMAMAPPTARIAGDVTGALWQLEDTAADNDGGAATRVSLNGADNAGRMGVSDEAVGTSVEGVERSQSWAQQWAGEQQAVEQAQQKRHTAATQLQALQRGRATRRQHTPAASSAAGGSDDLPPPLPAELMGRLPAASQDRVSAARDDLAQAEAEARSAQKEASQARARAGAAQARQQLVRQAQQHLQTDDDNDPPPPTLVPAPPTPRRSDPATARGTSARTPVEYKMPTELSPSRIPRLSPDISTRSPGRSGVNPGGADCSFIGGVTPSRLPVRRGTTAADAIRARLAAKGHSDFATPASVRKKQLQQQEEIQQQQQQMKHALQQQQFQREQARWNRMEEQDAGVAGGDPAWADSYEEDLAQPLTRFSPRELRQQQEDDRKASRDERRRRRQRRKRTAEDDNAIGTGGAMARTYGTVPVLRSRRPVREAAAASSSRRDDGYEAIDVRESVASEYLSDSFASSSAAVDEGIAMQQRQQPSQCSFDAQSGTAVAVQQPPMSARERAKARRTRRSTERRDSATSIGTIDTVATATSSVAADVDMASAWSADVEEAVPPMLTAAAFVKTQQLQLTEAEATTHGGYDSDRSIAEPPSLHAAAHLLAGGGPEEDSNSPMPAPPALRAEDFLPKESAADVIRARLAAKGHTELAPVPATVLAPASPPKHLWEDAASPAATVVRIQAMYASFTA